MLIQMQKPHTAWGYQKYLEIYIYNSYDTYRQPSLKKNTNIKNKKINDGLSALFLCPLCHSAATPP